MSKIIVLDMLPKGAGEEGKRWYLTGVRGDGRRAVYRGFDDRSTAMYYMLMRLKKGKPVAWWFPIQSDQCLLIEEKVVNDKEKGVVNE